MTVIKGVTTFHSETGTEGGYWAVQDEKFTNLVDERTLNTYRCSRCGLMWDKIRQPEEPKPGFVYWDGPTRTVQIDERTTTTEGGYRYYDEPHPELAEGEPGSVDEKWNKGNNATALECWERGHETWELMWPNGVSSYEGLHVLRSGDYLKVSDKDDPAHVKWEGEIKLEHHSLFTEHAFGMWIHDDQVGQDREAWAEMFMVEHPCELTLAADR